MHVDTEQMRRAAIEMNAAAENMNQAARNMQSVVDSFERVASTFTSDLASLMHRLEEVQRNGKEGA